MSPICPETWRALRDQLDSGAVAAKFSQEASVRLSAAYAGLGEEERPAVNTELLEWLKADDEALRFDALALIREHRITTAESALDDLTNYRGVLACLDPRSTEASDVAAPRSAFAGSSDRGLPDESWQAIRCSRKPPGVVLGRVPARVSTVGRTQGLGGWCR
jgi:hypothetical protein